MPARPNEGKQIRTSRFFFLLRLIHGLLDRPSRLAKTHQTDHAAAALERVERAPDRNQGFLVARFSQCQRMLLLNRLKHLLRLFEKDSEQLGIHRVIRSQRRRSRTGGSGWHRCG